jgi:hypothetical protein
MTGTSMQEQLGDLIAVAVASLDPDIQDRIRTDPSAHLDLISLMADAEQQSGQLLASAVGAARSAGFGWEAIGRQLGISRQAAQQRFGSPGSGNVEDGQASRMRLSPLTAENEMKVLNRAGRYGWHSVAFGAFYHDVELSSEQWEHRRVFLAGSNRKALEADGWVRIQAMWFPWAYYKRPTGKAALDQPEDIDFLDGLDEFDWMGMLVRFWPGMPVRFPWVRQGPEYYSGRSSMKTVR